MSHENLFVCGSLAEGMVHYGRVSEFVRSKRSATVRGSIYRLEVGFPVFSIEGSQLIRGQLLKMESQDVLGRFLDEFHGYSLRTPERSLHIRTEVLAELEDQTTETAIVYSINVAKLPKSAVLIEDGDWERDLAQKEPLTLSLTDRQKTYIRKLGASTGRDIVPINLDLYRELLNKGLIIDKGRRLALTRLGQEVFRFLD